MHHKHKQKTRIKSSRSEKHGLERFLTSGLFIFLGTLFLLIGLYYSFNSSEGQNGLYVMLMKLLEPTEDTPLMMGSGDGFWILFFYFLPAAILLIASAIYAKKFSKISFPLTLFTALYLIVMQIILSVYYTNNISYYPNFYFASVLLFLPVLLLFMSAYFHRRTAILIFSCFYFYISVLLYTFYYGQPFDYLFPYVLIFSALIFGIGKILNRPIINLVNFAFAFAYFSLFWIRKFAINTRPELLIQFFVLSILFYLLFYAIIVFASNTKRRPLRKWMQLVLTLSNLAFFLGSISFVVIKYYELTYLWIYVSVLLLFNAIGLYLIKKYNIIAWTLPYYFACILLAALILPLMIPQNSLLIFMAGLSVIMLIYAIDFKESAAMWISLGAMATTMVIYLFSWMIKYVPAIFAENLQHDNELMWQGIVSGVVMITALFISQFLLKKIEIPVSKKWLDRQEYNLIIRSFLFFSIFLTLGWSVFSSICQFSGTVLYASVAWFISGSLFFIFIIHYFSGIQSVFKKPLIYIAFSFAFLYPLLVHWNMTIYREKLILFGDLNATAISLHYLALCLLIIMGILSVKRIYWYNTKKMALQGSLQVLTITFLIFLLCVEYDNLSVLISSFMNQSNNNHGIGDGLLNFNQHLPYSIIIWFLSLIIFIWSIFQQNRILRSYSIFLFIGILVKVFAYDIESLNEAGRSTVFIVLGIFLIGFAFLYPRLLKTESKILASKHKTKIKAQQTGFVTDQNNTSNQL